MNDTPPNTPNADAPASQSWRIAIALFVVLVALVLTRWWMPDDSTVVDGDHPSDVAAEETDNPELGVTFAATGVEGLPREVCIAVGEEKISVFAALEQVQAVEPAWYFTYQGSGKMTMVTEIAGFSNEGNTGSNWTYEINGEMAPRSVGEMQVGRGDRVLWNFGTYE
ncbi:DUF4430 domain-containing protein [Aeoliella mucimassa]|uniref:Transcobalamin-like C-terminal domain-containing protein n=1 Tax=Aeoliella mucimassa TaxID=2527972 RepID=A0A518AVN8_9BACT|nr:DUF4430 domain-containing protein [Aeoliella mucimassa]QDU58772.1 hypothetical protein Pan181_50120 [Aeoliella mucimassa]